MKRRGFIGWMLAAVCAPFSTHCPAIRQTRAWMRLERVYGEAYKKEMARQTAEEMRKLWGL